MLFKTLIAIERHEIPHPEDATVFFSGSELGIVQITSVCLVWSTYHEGLFPATQHLTLFAPGHLPVTVLVPQAVLSIFMQAPPPPLHGPLYVESVVGPPTQHLKSEPPGHFPLIASPLH